MKISEGLVRNMKYVNPINKLCILNEKSASTQDKPCISTMEIKSMTNVKNRCHFQKSKKAKIRKRVIETKSQKGVFEYFLYDETQKNRKRIQKRSVFNKAVKAYSIHFLKA